MKNFFEEYFNEDHEGGPRHCVIMVNQRPSQMTLHQIEKEASKVHYLQGNPLEASDLARAKLP